MQVFIRSAATAKSEGKKKKNNFFFLAKQKEGGREGMTSSMSSYEALSIDRLCQIHCSISHGACQVTECLQKNDSNTAQSIRELGQTVFSGVDKCAVCPYQTPR